MSEDKSREIVQLDEITHMLLRPATFIGSVEPSEFEEWILNDEDKFELKKITYTPGLYRIFTEIFDNALDEYLRTNGKYSNKIFVNIEDNKITITDNGRGLNIKKAPDGTWQPVLAFCRCRAGSNFSDDGRETIGLNGIGSFATNVFSKEFEVVTCDGKSKMKITCKNNLSVEKHSVKPIGTTDKQGTKVSFIPDYERFGINGITEGIELLIKTRMKILSWFFPKCDFRYNNEKITMKAKEISSMFPEPSIALSTDNVYILTYATEEPQCLTYVNGISLRRGGTHIDYISNTLVSDLREKLIKKYKNIKPADIRNRLGFVVFFKDFPNCQFDSQTKELLSNNEKDIKAYLGDIDLTSKLSNKILKDKDFISNITDIFELKEELAEKKELAKLNKKVKTVDSDKYFPPLAHSGKKYLCITEGYSAFSGLSKILGRKSIGYYSLKGKPLNCQELSASKFMQNQEINDLVNILGIDLGDPNTDMTYEKVLFLADADHDGNAISSLLISLFARIAPKMFEEGRICRVNTPLLIGLNGNKVVEYYFSFPSKEKMNKRLTYQYLKGLGSWSVNNFNQILEKEGGLEGLLLQYTKDDAAKDNLQNWFGDDVGLRKDYLRGKEFHIDMM